MPHRHHQERDVVLGEFQGLGQGLVLKTPGHPGPQIQGPGLEKNILPDETGLHVGE